MNVKHVRLSISIVLSSPLHVGGGKGNVASYSYLQRDMEGRPYWPGSALKGKLRHTAMQLYSDKYDAPCAFSHSTDAEAPTCACMVCKLFGAAGNNAGMLVFSDLNLEDQPISRSDFRTGNTIDRYTHTAQDGYLFGIEVVAGDQPLTLRGIIEGYFSEDRYGEQKALLEASLKQLAFIGGNSSRGLGWVERIDIADESAYAYPVQADSMDHADVHRVTVELTPLSLSLIGNHSTQSNYRDTQLCIPGNVLRAWMAKEIVLRCGTTNPIRENYVTVPREDETDPALPVLRTNFTKLRISTLMPLGARAFPLTARKCKYADCKPCQGGYWDTLAKQLCVSHTNDAYTCPHQPEKRSERASGLFGVNATGLYLVSPDTMVVTKAAIDRYRNTAQDEMLYSMRMMTDRASIVCSHSGKVTYAPLRFCGTLEGEMSRAELKTLFAGEVHVGAHQTSGYGRMKAHIGVESGPKDEREGIRQRIERFNALVGTPEKPGVFVPITLLSDAFVTLPMELSPSDTDDDAYKNAYLSLFLHRFAYSGDMRMALAMAQLIPWRGFDTSQKESYLHDVRHKIRAGAVFVLEVDALQEALLDDLVQLQQQGICSEQEPMLYAQNGFGQVRVADDFHIDYAHQNR